jgi:hypothetical protein
MKHAKGKLDEARFFSTPSSGERAPKPSTQSDNQEGSSKSQGAYKATTSGIKIRDRFFAVLERVEAKLGGPAIGIALLGMTVNGEKIEDTETRSKTGSTRRCSG